MHDACVRAYRDGEACCAFCELELDEHYENLARQQQENKPHGRIHPT